MADVYYTHGQWKVKPGKEEEFIEAWKALGDVFLGLRGGGPSGKGILVQSITDPTLFYSFGPWSSLEAIQAMRGSPEAQAGIRRVAELCEQATPGTYRLVAESGS